MISLAQQPANLVLALRLPVEPRGRQPGIAARRGGSLIEVMLVLTVIAILTSLGVPSVRRAVEQSRADIAGANLRAIWSAERVYWLENHTYTSNFTDLASLVDPAIASSSTLYVYTISTADNSTFSAQAVRTGSSQWSGQLSIDQAGNVSGVIQAAGQPDITPGLQ
jgi:prepilin-type N-terminal cleavage/methylation domain-containing protein